MVLSLPRRGRESISPKRQKTGGLGGKIRSQRTRGGIAKSRGEYLFERYIEKSKSNGRFGKRETRPIKIPSQEGSWVSKRPSAEKDSLCGTKDQVINCELGRRKDGLLRYRKKAPTEAERE